MIFIFSQSMIQEYFDYNLIYLFTIFSSFKL